jgi:hypothetical protein
VPVGFSCSEVPDPPLLPEPGLSNLSGGGILVFEDAARCELTIANSRTKDLMSGVVAVMILKCAAKIA